MTVEKRVIFDGHYEIDSLGNITRLKGGRGAVPGRVVRWQRTTDGYARVSLSVNGKPKGYRVHTLVALAFLGPSAPGQIVNHKDGNRRNNCVENLEWASHQENTAHAAATGLMPLGSKRSHSKASEDVVREIRRAFQIGIRNADLAKQYGLKPSTIYSIVRRKTWKHVKDDPSLPVPAKNYKAGAKLILAQAREIRIAYDGGEPQHAIAQRYGIARATVSEIITGKTWTEDDYKVTNRGNHRKARRGSKNGNAVLDEERVRLILRHREEGWSYTKIAALVHAHWTTVKLVCQGKTWNHMADGGADRLTDDSSQRGDGSDHTSTGGQLELPGFDQPLRLPYSAPPAPPRRHRATTNRSEWIQLTLLPLAIGPARGQSTPKVSGVEGAAGPRCTDSQSDAQGLTLEMPSGALSASAGSSRATTVGLCVTAPCRHPHGCGSLVVPYCV